ncbi:MAG: 4'-phosphopantetheinyl transferase superfamily protein [Pleurocapsa sp. SU_5_0]|nr:4'-phosphopantetheinyl transferase superfamily protein [Pleurocapsa sp. SU_5_0]NJO97138.1 4'-phosphopantetheinyl transferase superfamily protein [Pleurocapsa sp. CRU_1_2]NJR47840.1 4'-phosphopantetheinyl transferase superfamily protein [Hyellaceae cyanobacterium CSU_1_1]
MMANSNIDSIWQTPLQLPKLKGHQVHIWRANLGLSTPEIEQLTTLLSTDEIARADKFRFAKHRRKFIAARGILRQLLGNYLEVSPRSLTFTYSDRGKPQLATDISLQFNLSHSEEYALFGFALNHLIGVDIEHQRAMPDALKIAQRFFSAREYKMLVAVPLEQQPKLFFQLWTAKEAYLKATGTGLSGSLSSVEICLDQRESLYLSTIKQDKIIDWSLYCCTPATDYAAAIAINAQISTQDVNYWHCNYVSDRAL